MPPHHENARISDDEVNKIPVITTAENITTTSVTNCVQSMGLSNAWVSTAYSMVSAPSYRAARRHAHLTRKQTIDRHARSDQTGLTTDAAPEAPLPASCSEATRGPNVNLSGSAVREGPTSLQYVTGRWYRHLSRMPTMLRSSDDTTVKYLSRGGARCPGSVYFSASSCSSLPDDDALGRCDQAPSSPSKAKARSVIVTLRGNPHVHN